jgi:selenide,water dikinase
MLQLNQVGSSLSDYVHAATDITGYGLLGHGFEMARSSNVTLLIERERVPVMEGTEKMIAEKMLPGGIMANRRYLGDEVTWGMAGEVEQAILLDPQTSGGLLVSLPRSELGALNAVLEENGSSSWVIGEVSPRGETAICII